MAPLLDPTEPIHLIMASTPSTLPTFAIVFFPKISARKLKIPAHVSAALQESVTLRDKWNNIWQVKARIVSRDWYLLDGWDEFVADNKLTYMDVLFFTVSGPGSLDVNILGADGHVKEGVGHHMIYISSDESEGADTLERVPYGKNKKLEYNNFVKAKGKKGKEILKNQDDADEYETHDNFAYVGGYQGGKREDESEESDEFEPVYLQNDKCKKVAKDRRKSRNDNYASTSRKPHQKKGKVDYLSEGILKSGQASKPKRSYSAKRMKPLYRNGSNKGKGIMIKGSENEEEEDDSEEESTELIPRNEQKGRGRVEKELRADVRTYTTAGSENPYQKRRNTEGWNGNKITSRNTKIPPATVLPPRRMNSKDNRGKGIRYESSDKDSDSDSDYRLSDSYDKISEEDSRSGINGLENAKKLNVEAKDVTAPEGITFTKRVKIDYTGQEIFRSGVLPRPDCTYFVTKMKPKRMKELHLPRDIFRYKDIPRKITLVDPRRNTYISYLDAWPCGRGFYREGWNLLCKFNHITRDDFCICAFGEGDLKHHLFVSFVRVKPDDK